MEWWEERDLNHAPVHYSNEEAHAWAAGWNAAVAEYNRELEEAMQSQASMLIPAAALEAPFAARTTDPDVSRDSAPSRRLVKIEPDSIAHHLLRRWELAGESGCTYHEATRQLRSDETAGRWTVEHFKSIARKATEFRRFGLISYDGENRDRAMVCRLTASGKQALVSLRMGHTIRLGGE